MPHDASPLEQPRALIAAAVLVIGLFVSAFRAAPSRPADVRRCWRRLLVSGAAFLGWMLLSASWAPDGRLAAHKLFELLILGAGAGGLAFTLWSGDARACRAGMLIAAVVGLLFLAAAGLLAGPMERAAVLGGGPNVYGRNNGVLLLLGLGAWQAGLGRAWLGPAAVASALVLLSGSRGALGATVGGVLLFTLLAGRGLAQRATIPAAIVTAAGALFILDPTLWAAARDVFSWRVLELTWQQGQTGLRDVYFELALEVFSSAPLKGAGLAAYPALTDAPYPHNLPLEVACEGGLVGVGLLLASTLLWAQLIWRLRPIDATTCSVMVVLAGSAQLSGDLYDSRGLVSWGLVALAAGLGREPDQDGPARPTASCAPATVVRA